MERFRLRVRHEPKRGQIWELHLFPERARGVSREGDARVLGTASAPEATHWLRQIAAPYLARAEAPEPISGEEFGPQAEPRWLHQEDGLRLALAFSAARWLVAPVQRRMFRQGLAELPSEVVLYWFTLCFYGYRQSAGRAALRTLLTYQETAEDSDSNPAFMGDVSPEQTMTANVGKGKRASHEVTGGTPRLFPLEEPAPETGEVIGVGP